MRLLSQEATQSGAKPQENLPPIHLPLINRRDLVRAALLTSAASALGPAFSFAQSISAGLTPSAQGENGAAFLTDPNWKTAFLTDHQNETLIALSDVIIPATETPGAKEALANRFIDLLLSVQPADFQKLFADALGSMDSASQEQFGKDFVALPLDDQIALLTPWAYPQRGSRWTGEERKPDQKHQHFELLKGLIADAYYESEIGRKELGWGEASDHDIYDDCGSTTTTPKPIRTMTHKPIHK
jgi:Gluconate 2-dehydrogenase subunit 3